MKLVNGIWDLKQPDRTKKHRVLKGAMSQEYCRFGHWIDQNQIKLCAEVITKCLFLYGYEEDIK